jgi:excisionase family DNA binding protein
MRLPLSDLRPVSSDVVSVAEAAARAKLTPRTIYRWIRERKIRAFGHGHGTRVLMGEVLAPRTPKDPKATRPRKSKQRLGIEKGMTPAALENTEPTTIKVEVAAAAAERAARDRLR